MINRVFVAIPFHAPLQCVPTGCSRNRQTIVDAGLEFGCFFIVVPGYELKIRQLLADTVHAIEFGKGLQPGLAALLIHNAMGTPRCERIVESFVSRSDGLLVRKRHTCVVEAIEGADAVIAGRRHYPGIAAIAKNEAKSTIILKNVIGTGA